MAPARLSTRFRRFLGIATLVVIVALAHAERPASAGTGSISGQVFTDLNNNGIIDGSEVGNTSMPTVFIDTDGNGLYDTGEPTATTDGSGNYTFSGLNDGTYLVRVIAPTGYGPTNSPVTAVISGGNAVLNTNLGVSNLGAISGYVYNDVNGNGIQDAGDTGSLGKSVFLDTNNNGSYNAGEPVASTDAQGAFSFTGLTGTGTYTVRMTVPATLTLTTAQPAAITLSPGVTATATFGVFTNDTIQGTVYNDVNGNGNQDAGDSVLAAKTVYVDANNNGIKDTNELSAVTNSSGVFSIGGVGPGSWAVRLVTTATVMQTSANPANIVTTSNHTFSGLLFGQFTLGSISGTIYTDTNASGAKDTSESGVSGRTVYIDANNNGTFDAGEVNATSSGTGTYSFPGLGPGTYQVKVVVPAGQIQTSADPAAITLTSAGNNSAINVGLYALATISGTVYDDTNGNATLNAGEPGLDTVTVYLDANNNGSFDTGETSTATDSTGHYTFASMNPGTYRVRVVLPSGYMQTSTLNPAIIPQSGSTTTANVGLFGYATISGTIYNDVTGNGVKDTGDNGIQNITVYLDANSNSVFDLGELSTTTDSSGNWSIANIGPGVFKPRIVVPTGQATTGTLPGAITTTSSLVDTSGNDIGTFTSATISGSVYGDYNGDGARELGDTGLAGKTLFLDANGDGLLTTGEVTTTTDTSGNYQFTGLGPGVYKPRLNVPAGSLQTSTNPANIIASSATASTGIDFAWFTTSTITGTIYNDVNGDGIKSAGDSGLASRTVYIDTNGNGTKDTGEPAFTTATGGAYSFTGLGPGTFVVKLITPAGSTQTSADPATVTTTSGSASAGNDFGLFTYGSITGTVYGDTNGNGSKNTGENGLLGKTVYIDANNNGTFDTGETSASTNTSGAYTFSGLQAGVYNVRLYSPAGYIQTSVDPAAVTINSSSAVSAIDFGAFTAASITGAIYNDVNGDGTKTTGDNGIAGLTVFLDTNGNGVADPGETTTTSDSAGAYAFANLGPGTYKPRVVFNVATQYVTTATLPAVTVSSGTAAVNTDLGVFTYGVVTGTIYTDSNGNGTKDTGEMGLYNVRAYSDTNGNSTYGVGEPTALADANGIYSISGLKAGTYKPRVVLPTGMIATTSATSTVTVVSGSTISATDFGLFTPGTITGRVYTDVNGDGSYEVGEAGLAGKTVFIDQNANGVKDTTEPSTTTVAGGTYTFAGVGAGTISVKLILPTGVIQSSADPSPITMTSGLAVSTGNDFGLFTNGSIAGTVYNDANNTGVRIGTDATLPGQSVYLDSNDNGVRDTGEPSTITSATGTYSFTNLGPGTYKVRVVVPTGSTQSSAQPAALALTSGLAATGYDFGIFTPGVITGTVYNDVNGNGAKDASEVGLAGIMVYLDTNNNGVYDSTETTATSNSTGMYVFSGLNAGVQYVRIVVPTGQTRSTKLPNAIAVTSASTTTAVDFGLHTGAITAPAGGTTTTGTTGPVVYAPYPASEDAMSANSGYWMISADGGVYAYGNAPFLGSATPYHPTAPIVGFAPTTTNQGYYEVASDGGIFAFGDARFYGSMGGHVLNKPIVGMAVTPSGNGYYEVASDGGVFSYGDAKFFGSTGSIKLNKPIVGMTTTQTGRGYWMVASDGGIFAFGDAKFYGSTGSIRLNKPIVGMARTASGAGYWMVASDGGMFAFGDAQFYGSMGTKALNSPIVAMSAPASGDGYWMFAQDGGVFAFGSSRYYGGNPGPKIVQ